MRSPVRAMIYANGIEQHAWAKALMEEEKSENDALPPSIIRYNIIMVLLSITCSEMQPKRAETVAKMRLLLRSSEESVSAKLILTPRLCTFFIWADFARQPHYNLSQNSDLANRLVARISRIYRISCNASSIEITTASSVVQRMETCAPPVLDTRVICQLTRYFLYF